MNKKILALCTILIAATLLFFLLPNDEKEIRRNMELLAEYSSSTDNDGTLSTITKSRSAANLCTKNCAIDIESYHAKQHLSRKEISDHIVLLKKMMPGTRFTFDDIHIDFQGENKALINATLSLNSKTEHQHFTDAYELKSSVVKVDGDWFFSSFTVVQFMER